MRETSYWRCPWLKHLDRVQIRYLQKYWQNLSVVICCWVFLYHWMPGLSISDSRLRLRDIWGAEMFYNSTGANEPLVNGPLPLLAAAKLRDLVSHHIFLEVVLVTRWIFLSEPPLTSSILGILMFWTIFHFDVAPLDIS